MPGLLDLPQELLVRIGRNLTTVQIGHLRCCNKQIEKLLFDDFANTYFTKRQFMIEQPSLEALVGIATHPGLASRLQEVIISTHTLGLPSSLQGATQHANKRFVNAGYVFREQFIHLGLARDMLVDAFSKLPNLRIVGVRDYDAAGRVQDAGRWRSWGWSWAAVTDLHAIPSSIFLLVLAALERSSGRPPNLEVFLRHPAKLGPAAFCLPSTIAHHSPNPPHSALSSLKTLMLAVNLTHGDQSVWVGTTSNYGLSRLASVCPGIESLQNFLHHTSNLETLRLNFDTNDDRASDFLRWLGRKPDPPQTAGSHNTDYFDVPPASLPKLMTLDLGKAKADPRAVLGALTRFNLQSFSLWDMVLQRDQGSLGDAWYTLLHLLADALPTPSPLRYVMIGRLQESEGWPMPVSFVPSGTAEKERENATKHDTMKFEKKFIAKEASEWLKNTAELLYRPPPPPLNWDHQDDGDENDEDDEGDQDEDEDEDEDDEDDE